MMIDNLQKAILNCLNNQSSDNFLKLNGIFNYIDKNQELPYIFYFINNIKDCSTYSSKIYSCGLSINIYDKNTSSVYIVNLIEEIKNIFKNINNLSTKNLKIIDIIFNEANIMLENNNTLWKGELNFTINFSYFEN